jgi:hypothetical protein
LEPRQPAASLYGNWLPIENPGAVDRLDDPLPSTSALLSNRGLNEQVVAEW